MVCVAWFSILYLGLISCSIINCKPDLTLLARISDNDYKYTCIIGNNESVNSVVFLTPLSVIHSSLASEFRTPEGIPVPNDISCDFENECSELFNNNNWETVPSANHLLSIIHDIRFEKLITYRTRNDQIPFEITEKDFYFPISVRAEDEPQILLCNDGNENIMQCYWIRIDNNDNIFEVAIRECEKVSKTQFSIRDSLCILNKSVEHNSKLVRDLDWFHYILLRNGNTIIFKDGVSGEEYIKLDDVKYDTKKMYIKTSNGKRGEWKIHKNSYLKLKTFDSEVQLGPTFSLANKDNFCISMLVSICLECSFEIRINNEAKKIFSDNSTNWRNITLTAISTETKEFKIFVNASRSNNNDIIAIDNIRRCHEHEIRILRINNIQKLASISCKVLSYPSWYSTWNYNSRNSNDICADAKYIGKNCDIPCSAVLGQGADTKFCNKHFICKPTENYYEQNCVCAAGYRGDNCDEICEPINFGYNCQKRCGQCINNDTCLKSSGICNDGCESGYFPNMCVFKLYEPVNLSCIVDENGQILLNWQHPKCNELVFMYNIIISLLHSTFKNIKSKIEENAIFSDRKENYSYKPKTLVCPSSTYNVAVCGKGIITQCSKNILITFPKKPSLTESYITVKKNNDHSKIITIPAILPDTKSIISNMYVTVCDEDGNGAEIKFSKDSEILSKIVCAKKSWIASKNEMNTSEVTLIIGEGQKTGNVYDNPPLGANNIYNICVVLINEYKNKTAFNVYCENNNTSPSVWITVGIMAGALIISVIAFLIKKLCDKMKGRSARNTNITDNVPLECYSETASPLLHKESST